MATKSNRALNDELRKVYMEKIKAFLESEGEEVLVTAGGELCFPVVDSEGNDKWIQLPFKVPSGSRDGDAFDGYALAEEYQMAQKEKAAKKAEADRKKAEKAKKDAAAREAKKAEKAAKEAEKAKEE